MTTKVFAVFTANHLPDKCNVPQLNSISRTFPHSAPMPILPALTNDHHQPPGAKGKHLESLRLLLLINSFN